MTFDQEKFDEMHELSGAYVLGALSSVEFEAFEVHLEACGTCEAEVADLMNGLMALRELDEPVLGAALTDRLLQIPDSDTVGPNFASVSTDSQEQSATRLRRGMFALAAAVVVVVGSMGAMSLFSTSLSEEIASAADVKVLTMDSEGVPSAALSESASVGAVAFIDQDFTPLESTERYALWKLNEDETVAFVGFVNDSDQTAVTQSWAVDLGDAIGFALSIETSTEAPTTPSDRITYVGT